jgi:ankyrin repeat protein
MSQRKMRGHSLGCRQEMQFLFSKLLPPFLPLLCSDGFIPLMLASQGGFLDCMRLVLAAHDPAAQVTAVNQSGRNALMIAAMEGQSECVQLLLGQSCVREQLEAADEDGYTAFLRACDEGHSACVRLLLAAGDAAAQVQATEA